MTSVNLDANMVSRLTEDPALYVEVPFLTPMKGTALSIHRKLPRHCKACHKGARTRAMNALSNAFGRLVVDESKRDPNGLPKLRFYVTRRFALKPGTPITLQYTENGQNVVLNI